MLDKLKIALFSFLVASLTGIPNMASATDLNISQNPLFLATSIDPNIMFTLDDSGSMHWEFMPDDTQTFNTFTFPRPANPYGSATQYANQVALHDDNNLFHFWARSSNNNAVFYNPDIDYQPWVNADGTEMPQADPTCALYNIRRPGQGCLNLTVEQTQTATWFSNSTNTDLWSNDWACLGCARSYWPITYFNFIGGDPRLRPSYQLVQITTATPAAATFTSPGGVVRTRDEEIQNFANWFQYHRSRILAARAGIGRAFLQLPGNARLGFGAINAASSNVDGVNTSTIVDPVRPLTTAQRLAFYDRLYDWPIPRAGTPLRRAANDVGEYFERADNLGPWSTTPGVATAGETPADHLSCRQSFHILMTDGFWNGSVSPGVGNADNTSGPVIAAPDLTTFQYVASDPFRDNWSNTLADVGMHYWKRDLRPDLANRVPTNPLNPAFWQHVSTYGIGLGVVGSIDPDDAFEAIGTGDEVLWPEPFADAGAPNIDDLLHFGVNGRGGFFSAGDPDTFAEELGNVLEDIVARAAATTGVAVSATRLTTDAFVYTGDFDSENWTGQLRALDPEDGEVEWSASDELESLGAAGRNIFSYDPDDETGIEFTAGATDIDDRLMDPAPSGGDWTFANLVNYLRGSAAHEERNGGTFRDRDSMLGDIVNSRPVFSGRGNEGWAREYADYIDYIDGPKRDPRDCGSPCNKRETVFIGANGGMLHAFDGRNGVEHFAYVPAAVHENLHELADPDYSHRFFADGQITIADARIGGGAQPWRSVLVGGLGAGGRGIYALDVTEPQNFNQSKVLWEFTHEDDPDLGFTFGEPLIARLENGDWVAIFGNGYNSQDNQAYLFVLDLDTGDLRNKIALGNPGGNGLSGVVGWRDVATRTSLERVYAGDLNGTVWRVDFTSSSPSVKYSDGLFTDPNGRAITATPNLAAHPGGGLVVYFGTGKLIENSDRLETEMERFYALRDRDSAVGNNTPAMNDFAEAEIATAAAIPGQPPLRTVVNTDGIQPNGWYVDLAVGAASGERVLAPPRVVFGRVVVASYEPIEDPCRPGGVQRTYVLDALSGDGALPFCPGCGAVEIGSGAPFSPPIAIRPQQPGTGTDVTFPGHVDPEDPQPFPLPPDPTGDQTTRGWCSEFGIPPLFQGGSFLSLGTICEGRQVWRQVR